MHRNRIWFKFYKKFHLNTKNDLKLNLLNKSSSLPHEVGKKVSVAFFSDRFFFFSFFKLNTK